MKQTYFARTQYLKRSIILQAKGITYQEFLKSNDWKKAKDRLYKREGKLCKICGRESYLNVHHNKYNEKNLGGSIQGLVVLCRECHEEVHRISKIRDWAFKRSVRSLEKRFKKYGSIDYYPANSSVKEFQRHKGGELAKI